MTKKMLVDHPFFDFETKWHEFFIIIVDQNKNETGWNSDEKLTNSEENLIFY